MKKVDRDAFMARMDAVKFSHKIPDSANVMFAMDGTVTLTDDNGVGVIGKGLIISRIHERGPRDQAWMWPWNYPEPGAHIEKAKMIAGLSDKYPDCVKYVNMDSCKMTCIDHEVMLRALAAHAYKFDYVTELTGCNALNIIGVTDLKPHRLQTGLNDRFKEAINASQVHAAFKKAGLPVPETVDLPGGGLLGSDQNLAALFEKFVNVKQEGN